MLTHRCIMFASLLTAHCFAQPEDVNPGPSSKSLSAVLSRLAMQVESGNVQSLDVFYIPTYIIYDVRVTPERMLNEYRYKVSVRDFSNSGESAPLLSALKRTTVKAFSGPADLRWGVSFRFVDGSVHEVYLDGSGHYGRIDNLTASFEGGLYNWLRQLTACLK
jgi:hypothetical protein